MLFRSTLAIAFGLVVLIIFVFLRDLRATVIPTVAIPVSIVGTFAALHLMGYSVNILTMLALTVGGLFIVSALIGVIAAGIATLAPRHGMALAICYALFFDAPLGVLPATLKELSVIVSWYFRLT